ncbi:MAG: sigma-70 family RNA polymerase sigma factor [Clostridia bacterium]|nr:sigma-70 family RNA polymerase sigma factor [Clostridia bacterium]
MKKLSTTVTKNNITKTIYAIVDDRTAKFLEGLDEQTRHDYIVSEHEIYLSELKETRRHQSLELSLENGHEFISEEPTPDEKCIEEETCKTLHNAISTLSEEQQWLVNEFYFKGRSNMDIAKELGVDKSAISHRLERILKKLKKILN